jgi:peptidoglycan/xylan/chitin deacetylase (PgdA/CDA1 family)
MPARTSTASVLTLALVALAAPASGGQPRDVPVPILMYHVVAAAPAGARYPELYVTPQEFAAQIDVLAKRGYRAMTLRQVHDAWHGRGQLPGRPVVISFDDGYRSQFANALPVLRLHRWPGVLNLDLSNVGDAWRLTPTHVRTLVAAGWEIDSHTLTHPDLTTLDAATLRREVAHSRAELRRRFGVAADFFCYPSGRYDARVVAAVRAAGYLGATTVEYGLARSSESFTLDRVRVNGADGAAGLVAKLKALGLS